VADHVRLKEILEELKYVALVEDKGTTEAASGRVNVEYILRLKAARSAPSTRKETGS
jgi:hypothetical protein